MVRKYGENFPRKVFPIPLSKAFEKGMIAFPNGGRALRRRLFYFLIKKKGGILLWQTTITKLPPFLY